MSLKERESPCFVPPHPALLARTRLLRSQGLAKAENLDRTNIALPGPSDMLGLDDGTIFPRSHFSPATSIKKITAAARERTPLRNAIK